MSGIRKHLLPPKPKHALKEKYLEHILAWRKFSSRAQQNSEIKKFVFERDKVCQACSKNIELEGTNSLIIHHMDYDHSCGFDKIVMNKNNRELPDCGSCRFEKPELFSGCVSRLAAVHKFCNHRIELMARRYYSHETSANIAVEGKEDVPFNDGLDWLQEGVVLAWSAKIRSAEKISKTGRRRITVGMQEVTGCVDVIEGEYVVIQVLGAKVLETNCDATFHLYKAGELVRKKRSSLIKLGAKKVGETVLPYTFNSKFLA